MMSGRIPTAMPINGFICPSPAIAAERRFVSYATTRSESQSHHSQGNAFGVFIGTQEAARQMMAQGSGGKIINTASIAGRQGYAEFAPYCASKAVGIAQNPAAQKTRPPV